MKHFNEWNQEKIEIDTNRENELITQEREIWWCSLGLNIGDEEDGKSDSFERPVVVLKKFNNRVVWILPLTSRPGNPKFYFNIKYSDRDGYVILSQIRIVSVKRLKRLMCLLSQEQFAELKNRIIKFLI